MVAPNTDLSLELLRRLGELTGRVAFLETLEAAGEEKTTIASSATPSPTGGSFRNRLTVTALAVAAQLQAPSGTPSDGNMLIVRWLDNGTARAIIYNAIYRGIVATPAATTVISKTLYQLFMYNSAGSGTWDLIGQVQEP